MTSPSLLLDLSHTSHTRARTGIQRVCRSLHQHLGTASTPITYDPWRRAWRCLEAWEHDNLTIEAAAKSRGAHWPWPVRFRGHLKRWLSSPPPPPTGQSLLVPEVFSPHVAAALPRLFNAVSGPRVALFHDAIALKVPELTPSKTVARFPAYLVELLAFDGIAVVSEDSKQSLLDYWSWLGVKDAPAVTAIPLGVDTPAPIASSSPPATTQPIILSVGSIEGRKNHVALLEACEALWQNGTSFELHLIGLAHPQTGRAALDRIQLLQRAGRPLRYSGAVSDAEVERAYQECTFTVYPSLIEGFGLPVLESVIRGKPCICSRQGALGEAAQGGGCLTLPSVDAPSLSAAIARLLGSVAEREQLAASARARRIKTWATYAQELSAWIGTVPRRAGFTHVR